MGVQYVIVRTNAVGTSARPRRAFLTEDQSTRAKCVEYNSRINTCLAAIHHETLAVFQPHLFPVAIERHQDLTPTEQSSALVLFPVSGIVALVYREDGQESSAIAIIGSEGIANYHMLFSPQPSPYGLVGHVAGEALAIRVEIMRALLANYRELQSVFLKYGAEVHLQIAANLRSSLRDSVGKRLARLLLMQHDRVEGDNIAVLHSTMANMLAVRRASVSDAMHYLESLHAVRDTRGRTTITDRNALIEIAGSSYGEGEKLRQAA